VAAILFFLQNAFSALDEISPTEMENKWIEPKAVTSIRMDSILRIDFKTAESKASRSRHWGEEKTETSTGSNVKRYKVDTPETTAAEKNHFFSALDKLTGKESRYPLPAAILTICDDYCNSMSQRREYPMFLRQLYEAKYVSNEERRRAYGDCA